MTQLDERERTIVNAWEGSFKIFNSLFLDGTIRHRDSLAIGSLVTKRRERKERRKGRRRGREEKKERREGGWEGGRDLAGQKDRNCPDS